MVPEQSRRERKKQKTRDDIVGAARGLFVLRGYDGVTIPDIAESAEVAVSTVFAHFQNKNEIFFAGWTALTEDFESYMSESSDTQTVLERLRRWYVDTYPTFANTSEWWGHERHRIIAETPELDAQRRHRIAKLERALAETFAREVDEEPTALRPRLLAATTLASILTLSGYWYENGLQAGVRSPAEAIEYALAIVEAGTAAVMALEQPPF